MDEHERRATLMRQLQVLGEISATETALFQQVAAAKVGLGITDMKALSALVQEGPMTAGQLAKRLSLTTGAVTSVIDRLQRQGFAVRMPDPNDRRKVIVAANAEKLATGDNIYLSMGTAFAEMLAGYTTEQLEFLVGYFDAAIALTRREIAKLADGDDEP